MKPHVLFYITLFCPFVLAADTVLVYHFDGTNGVPATTIVDSGPSGLNGSIVGAANYTNGPVGSALDLTGDFNYVTIPQTTSLVLSNSWTVEMLFRVNVPYVAYGSDPAALINKLNTSDVGLALDSFQMQLGSAGVIYSQIGFGNLTGQELDTGSTGNYSDGQWHHVALVYQVDHTTGTNTLSIYADHVLANSVSGAFPPIDWESYPINIGAGNYPAEEDTSPYRRNFDGQVDEVRISNVALTPDQFVSVTGGRNAPLSIQGEPGGVLLSWGSVTNEAYQLQTRTDLGQGSWINFGGPVPGTGSMLSSPDSFVTGRAQSFYQLLISP